MKRPCLALAIFAALLIAAAPVHSGGYARGVNAALNETLIVGAEWRELGLHPTWAQLDAEVARRLGVKRDKL